MKRTKYKIKNNLYDIKIKLFCSSEDTINKMRRQSIDNRKHLENTYLVQNSQRTLSNNKTT